MAKAQANGERFLMIPAEILTRTDIGPGPKLLLARLHDYSRGSGEAYPGIRHLQASLGVPSRGTLQRWIDVLVRMNLIAVVPGTGRRTNTYSVPVLSTLEGSRSVPKTETLCPQNENLASPEQVRTILDHTRPDQRDGLGKTGTQEEGRTEVDEALDLAQVMSQRVRRELVAAGVTVEQVRSAYAKTNGAADRGAVTATRLRETLKSQAAAKAARKAKEGREARERAERAQETERGEATLADRNKARAYLESISEERRASAWKACKASHGLNDAYLQNAGPSMFPTWVADEIDPAWRDAGAVPG